MLRGGQGKRLPALASIHHTIATAALRAATSPRQMVAHSQSTRALKLSSGSSISVDTAMRGENQFRGRSEATSCKSGEKKRRDPSFFFYFGFINSCCHCGEQRDAVASLRFFFLLSFSLNWLLRGQTMASIQGRKSWNTYQPRVLSTSWMPAVAVWHTKCTVFRTKAQLYLFFEQHQLIK